MNKLVLYLFFIFIAPLTAYTQTLQELQERRKKTEDEIKLTESMLSRMQQQRTQTVEQLSLLKNQINLRAKLIADLNKQLELKEVQIDERSSLIQNLNKDLENLKAEYAKLIQFAWKNRKDMNILVFIFASHDFNQAYRRLRFYQQFIKFREKQAQEIISTQRKIKQEVTQLNESRREIEKTRTTKNEEIITLNNQQRQYQRNVNQLRTREGQLRKELDDRRQSMEALEKAITDLIKEEARRATLVRDSRYLELSRGFNGNKGRLPWPITQGIIVGEFGEHEHPVLKGVIVRNNGVDIRTKPNAEVNAIYEGVVNRIVSIPGANAAVIIRHGDFLTVYSNIVKVSVKVGDKVLPSQKIGEVYTDPQEGAGKLNLQIWQESNIQNPRDWILP